MTRSRRPLVFVFVAAAFALLLAAPTSAGAQMETEPIGEGENIGVGLGTGTYTSGLTGKAYLDEQAALQLFLGSLGAFGRYGCGFGCGFAISGDYVGEFDDLLEEVEAGELFLGVGGGGFVYDWNGFGAGVNGVFEVGWHFREVPVELIIDVRPLLGFDTGSFRTFNDEIFFDIDGGAAVRYYF
jgi:hypothetical protein